MSNNDRDGDARGHFNAASGRGGGHGRFRMPSPARRDNEFLYSVANIARLIGERRRYDQGRQINPGRSHPKVETEIFEALAPLIGPSWQAELQEVMYNRIYGLDPDENNVGGDDDGDGDGDDEDDEDEDDEGEDGAGDHEDAAPEDNPPAGFPDARTEMEQTVAALRADPLIHRPEERNNPILDRRLPGSADAAFKPSKGDIILRISPEVDGSDISYCTGAINQTAVQAGDRVVRIFYDNMSEQGFTVTYAELHLCVGNEGPPELPEFLYFGRTIRRVANS